MIEENYNSIHSKSERYYLIIALLIGISLPFLFKIIIVETTTKSPPENTRASLPNNFEFSLKDENISKSVEKIPEEAHALFFNYTLLGQGIKFFAPKADEITLKDIKKEKENTLQKMRQSIGAKNN